MDVGGERGNRCGAPIDRVNVCEGGPEGHEAVGVDDKLLHETRDYRGLHRQTVIVDWASDVDLSVEEGEGVMEVARRAKERENGVAIAERDDQGEELDEQRRLQRK